MRKSLAALIGLGLAWGAAPAAAQEAPPPAPVVSCTTWSADRVDCFARGTNAKMFHRWRNGADWGGWELLGGTLRSLPSCTAWAPNRIDCFAAGIDLTLWQRTWAGGPEWGPGTPFTEGWGRTSRRTISAEPSCVTFAPERIDCFGVDRERVLVRQTFEGGRWRAPERLPGLFLPLGTEIGPRCVAVNDGSAPGATGAPIWCFVRGRDNALWMVRVPGERIGDTPPAWVSLGGVLTSLPSCVANDVLTVRCFVRGTDNAMYWQTIDPRGGQGWRSLGGVLTSEPSCISYAVLRIDCFVRGTDNAMYHMAATPSGTRGEAFQWSGWQSWGGTLTSAPTCVTHRATLHMEGEGHARIDCFVRGTDRALWHIASYPTGRTSWRSLGGQL